MSEKKVGRKAGEGTVMTRIPVSLHEHLSALGNVRNMIVKACVKQYGYIEKKLEGSKIKNPFL